MDKNILSVTELSTEIHNLSEDSELEVNLRIQLEEIEILRAMYYNDREFVTNTINLAKVRYYVNKISRIIPPLLEFVINLKIDTFVVEVEVILPRTYPKSEPQVTVRSNQLNRHQQSSLNNDLKCFISSLDRGIICICESISWLTDNLYNYTRGEEKSLKPSPEAEQTERTFSRYWIYSHHIYNKEKRKEILALARTYNLTGFCLSGKPGIICVEGWETDCEDWWQKIKSMTWKKILCNKKEDIKVKDSTCDILRKFSNFVEVNFQNSKGKSHDAHSDMGGLYRYLLEHDCGYAFKDYFGIEGKVSNT